MRDDQPPRSFFELEEIIREMEILELNKAKENYPRLPSKSDHAADVSDEPISEFRYTMLEEVWVKRDDDENIWSDSSFRQEVNTRRKRKSRKTFFFTLSECPLSFSKTRDSSNKRSSCSNTSLGVSDECQCGYIPTKGEQKKMPKYMKQQVAEFYGTNTVAMDLFSKSSKSACSCNATDKTLTVAHKVHFEECQNRFSDVTGEIPECIHALPVLQGNMNYVVLWKQNL